MLQLQPQASLALLPVILEAPLAISGVLIHLVAFEAPTLQFSVFLAPNKRITRLDLFGAIIQLVLLPQLPASISLPPHRALSRQLPEPQQGLPEQPPPIGASHPFPQALGDPAI